MQKNKKTSIHWKEKQIICGRKNLQVNAGASTWSIWMRKTRSFWTWAHISLYQTYQTRRCQSGCHGTARREEREENGGGWCQDYCCSLGPPTTCIRVFNDSVLTSRAIKHSSAWQQGSQVFRRLVNEHSAFQPRWYLGERQPCGCSGWVALPLGYGLTALLQ